MKKIFYCLKNKCRKFQPLRKIEIIENLKILIFVELIVLILFSIVGLGFLIAVHDFVISYNLYTVIMSLTFLVVLFCHFVVFPLMDLFDKL